MNKLERIRGYLERAPHWGLGQQDCEFLLQAVEQLVKYIVAMRKTAPYPSVQRRLLDQVLDPDIRELVESE